MAETLDILVRRVADIADVLCSKDLPREQPVYYVLRFDNPHYGKEPNITVIPPARLGKEFPKTYGHFHRHDEPETYRVLYGKALVLLQKMRGEIVEDVRVLSGESGAVLHVLEGYGHCLINATDDLLITADWEAEGAGHIYDLIKEKQGMAYYLLERDGKVVWEANTNYHQSLPELKFVT